MTKDHDSIQQFRQPMVTAIALILGFSIGFLADWVTEVDFQLYDKADGLLLFGMTLSLIFLVVKLFRILKMDYPKDKVLHYYNQTLMLFMIEMRTLFICLILSSLI